MNHILPRVYPLKVLIKAALEFLLDASTARYCLLNIAGGFGLAAGCTRFWFAHHVLAVLVVAKIHKTRATALWVT
jgi:hypothetical protein